MSGRKSKDKGYRDETNHRKRWEKAGFRATRMPLSGALGGDFSGDLRILMGDISYKVQCKCKADGFKTIYNALKDHDILHLKADNKPSLTVIETDMYLLQMTELQRLRDHWHEVAM